MHQRFLALFFIYFLLSGGVFSQTNPVAQPLPYTQDFGNNWFNQSGLPAGFAIWTASSAPRVSNTSAANSTANGDDNSFDSSTVVKSPGKSYGYSGISAGGQAINNGEIYIQTSSNTSGTDQIVLALNTSGYSSITVSFDVEMINPQPKLTGFAFQYRVGTTGAFTTIDSSYWHNSSDRIQNQVDNFINLTLPSPADDQPVVQLRWATSRDVVPSGMGSCGLGFDNIIVTGNTSSGQLHFRSVMSGNWNSASIWESSPDSIVWTPALRSPSSSENSIVICSTHSVSTSGISKLVVDQLTVEYGAVLQNDYNTLFSVNDGAGSVDLNIQGTFIDSSNYSVIIPSSATWMLGNNGTLVKTTNTSSLIWQLHYYNGIANIPATSNWICRKPLGASTEPSISSTNGGPPYPQVYFGNLFIENNSASWNPNNLCRFSGYTNFPVIKGNLQVGGNGTGNVDFYNSNTHSSPVKVCGNVIINSGSTLTVNGTGLEVQGKLLCNGTFTYGVSTSKLLFSGANTQVVSGTGTINAWKLEINKTFGDVNLSTDINVFGNLNLITGIFNTNALAKIIVNNDATATFASNLSFVSGPVQKKGDDAFTFPVGKGSNYQPVAMNAGSGASVTDAFTAEYFYSNPQLVYGNTLGPGLNHISSCEYWTLTKDNGSAQKNVTLTWDANSCGVTNLSTLRVARFNSAMWVNEGNAGTTGNISAGTITSSVTTGFGPFTLASITAENPLPLTLLYFTASYDGRNVKLNWVTASEVNTQSFIVERSADGKKFEAIATVAAAGNSTSLTEYSSNDYTPLSGVSYYRLRQVDFDGKLTYSDMVPVKITKANVELVSLVSSRANSSITIVLDIPEPIAGRIEITDMGGQIIHSSDFESRNERETFNINLSNPAGGVYYLRIFYEGEVLVKKFLY